MAMVGEIECVVCIDACALPNEATFINYIYILNVYYKFNNKLYTLIAYTSCIDFGHMHDAYVTRIKQML